MARGVECCDERHDDEQRFDAFAQEDEHGVNDAVAGAGVDGFEVTHQGLQAGDVRRLAAFAHDDRQFAFDAGVERAVAGLHVAFKDGPLLDEGADVAAGAVVVATFQGAQAFFQQFDAVRQGLRGVACDLWLQDIARFEVVERVAEELRLFFHFGVVRRLGEHGDAQECHGVFDLSVVAEAGFAHDFFVERPGAVEAFVDGLCVFEVMRDDGVVQLVIDRHDALGEGLARGGVVHRVLFFFKGVERARQGFKMRFVRLGDGGVKRAADFLAGGRVVVVERGKGLFEGLQVRGGAGAVVLFDGAHGVGEFDVERAGVYRRLHRAAHEGEREDEQQANFV